MLYVYTGNGKGKTTAALGTALRAIGYGWKVCMIQCMKGTRDAGEHKSIERLAPNLELIRGTTGFYKILDDNFTDKEHKKVAMDLWNIAEEKIRSQKYQLIILDELNVVLSLGLLPQKPVLTLFKILPKNLHIIATGRNAPKSLRNLADLVSDITEEKHPFQKKIPAQKGLDF